MMSITLRARVVVGLVLLGACTRREGGFTAQVKLGEALPADCVSVAVSEVNGGAEKSTPKAARAPNKHELGFGVVSGEGLQGQIRVVARAWLGDCTKDSTLKLNAESAAQTYTFVPGSASDVVTLELSSAIDDADNDGFRSGLDGGGTDCNDNDRLVSPRAVEACSNGRDDDCNGKSDCFDPPCENVSCDDGQKCSNVDVCRAGKCVGGSATCKAPAGECYSGAQCSDDGGCAFIVAVRGPCDGGSCRPDGTCAPTGTEVDCSDGADDDGDGKTDCADTSDCVFRGCTGDRCTTSTQCLADGTCGGGTPKSCSSPPNDCFVAAQGSCDPSTGNCKWPTRSGSCNDGRACTQNDQCASDGGCAGSPMVCQQVDDGGCLGPVGQCNENSGSCQYPPRTGNTCDDGILCTLGDVCSGNGTCAGTPFSCNPPVCYQSGACLMDGGCAFVASPPGAACDGGQCTGSGACVFDPAYFVYSPSNFSTAVVTHAQAGGSLVINCAATFNSSGGSPGFSVACPGQAPSTVIRVPQPNGPEVVVVSNKGLVVTDGGSLRLEGDRPVVFAVFGDAIIDGTIDARSTKGAGALGAGATSSDAKGPFCGQRAGMTGRGNNNGGGGGGAASFATTGGNGGAAGNAEGGNAGIALSDLRLIPLVPGCPGGNGGRDSNSIESGQGGPGGGAVQISATDKVRVGGVITVSGAGGLHGVTSFTGGGGAGSGGAILLEGRTVDLLASAIVTSNGGGGGEGAADRGVTANDGDDGAWGTGIPAPGGTGHDAGPGGNGGVMTNPGSPGGASPYGGGGGGGGVGPLRINAFIKCTSNPKVLSAYLTSNSCF